MKAKSVVVFLLIFFTAAFHSRAQILISPYNSTGLVGNDFQHGIFYVPKTAEAQQDFENNGYEYSAVRLHIVESALNNTTNLNDCLSFLDLAEVQLQDISNRSEEVIFIFEKMPAWLSSSSDGSPAQTPGWFVLNTKPPADYNAWNSVVAAITNHLVNDFGINNAYFEIWNEPDLGSWTGTESEYFELFENTYDAIKSINTTIPVGGPATNFWGNHINWQPPYGYLNNTLADSSLIGALLDSTATWNKPIDFVSWHNFHIIHSIQNNIESYLTNKCNALGIVVPKTIISEWNTPSILRETELQHSFFIKNQMELAKTNVDANVIAAWQDFNYNPQEFHSDYGLLSYGAIHKPAYNALLLSNRISGNYVEVLDNNYDLDFVAAVSNDTLRILISNYAPDPFVEALNETLFEGQFTLIDLDNAGFIDLSNNSISPLDSIYKGLIPLAPITPLEIAIDQSIQTYFHFSTFFSASRNIGFIIENQSGSISGSLDLYAINSEENNSIFTYDSFISNGLNQTDAIDSITQDQSIHPLSPTDYFITFINVELAPNEVMLIEATLSLELGDSELMQNSSVKIYPNPTDDLVRIDSNQPVFACSILDVHGKLILEHRSHLPIDQLSVERLESGIYFLHLEGLNNVKRFIKN